MHKRKRKGNVTNIVKYEFPVDGVDNILRQMLDTLDKSELSFCMVQIGSSASEYWEEGAPPDFIIFKPEDNLPQYGFVVADGRCLDLIIDGTGFEVSAKAAEKNISKMVSLIFTNALNYDFATVAVFPMSVKPDEFPVGQNVINNMLMLMVSLTEGGIFGPKLISRRYMDEKSVVIPN